MYRVQRIEIEYDFIYFRLQRAGLFSYKPTAFFLLRLFASPFDSIPNSFMEVIHYHCYHIVDCSNCNSYIPFAS
jgi:hypothetical protein